MKQISVAVILSILVMSCSLTFPLEEAGEPPACPICGGTLITERHPGAAVWCEVCGYVVQEEEPVELISKKCYREPE